ncbi:MAG: Heptaprenyl diphosphate synthase component [Firmicutes bacterium]|nr:Heptaprenyl diphosphate synthase component [Bacillota bacterium]
MNIRRMIILGLFVAIAGVLHAVECWVPLPLPIPGVKLGLANIVALAVIELYGWRDALVISILRVFLGTLLAGVIFGPAFIMSFAGAVASTLAMAVGCKYLRSKLFSLVGISVIGALVHNIAQLSIAAVLVVSSGVFWFLPYLVLFSVPTGVVTGVGVTYFFRKLPQNIIL